MSLLPLLSWTLLLLIQSGGSLHASSPRNQSLSSATASSEPRSLPPTHHHHLLQEESAALNQRTAPPAGEEEEEDSQQCASCALARMSRSREEERERRRTRRSSEQQQENGEEVVTEEQEEVVEAVKRHILNMLHLRVRPNITRPVPRAALLNALRKLHVGRVAEDGSVQIEGGEEEEATMEEERRRRGGRRGGRGGGMMAGGDAAGDFQDSTEIITFAEAGESQGLVNFVLSREGGGVGGGGGELTLVEQANVWLFLRLSKTTNRSRAKVSIRLYQQQPPSAAAGGTEELLLAEKTVDTRRSGWHTFAVSPAVQGLLEQRRGRAGGDAERSTERRGGATLHLRVSCPLCGEAGATLILVSPAADSTATPSSSRASQREQSHRPFLMAVVRPVDGEDDGEGGRRGARSRRGLECDGKVHVCCKRHFYVNFKDIGWNDWIIAPPGYHANYCEGECPSHVASVTGSTLSFHSTVINHYRMRGYSPFQGLRSCCVPTRLRAMSMLYYNEEQKIVKKDIHNMIVEECGCS